MKPMPRLIYLFCGALCILSLFSASPTKASHDQDVPECDSAARNAARRYDVPLDIMLSIARVESGRGTRQDPWPWTINSEGKGYWFETKQDAIDFASDQLAAGSANFDIGCFQINLQWHPDAFASLEDALDPATNADYAARFLASLFQSDGDWKSAVAAYHSRSADLGQTYVALVEDAFANRLQTPTTDTVPVTSEAEPSLNRFPLLQSGETSGLGSLVPRQSEKIALIEEAP